MSSRVCLDVAVRALSRCRQAWRWRVSILIACSGFAGGCSAETRCEADLLASREAALLDAEACDFSPEAVDPQDCSGLDGRPRRAYIGVFCSTAALGCLEADDELVQACFGRPEPF